MSTLRRPQSWRRDQLARKILDVLDAARGPMSRTELAAATQATQTLLERALESLVATGEVSCGAAERDGRSGKRTNKVYWTPRED